MNTLIKFAAPVLLSVAALSAHAAGPGQIPNYGETATVVSANAAAAVGSIAATPAGFRGQEATTFKPAAAGSGLTRAEVRRDAIAANQARLGSNLPYSVFVNY